jgi:hypothetical protein
MSKTLLLDIDGVLVRDQVLMDHIKFNIVRYVNKKLPGCGNPRKLNNLLYRAYGHTAVGLRKEYGLETHDFDSCVYTPQVIGHLEDYLDTPEFHMDADIIRNVLSLGWNVELFSNAPLVWSEPVKYSIDPLRVRNSGVCEKPKFETYMKFDPFRKYVFVDDKVCNLLPTLVFDNWKQIHFTTNKHEGGQFMTSVSSMDELFKKIQPLSDHPATLSWGKL